MVSHSKFPGGAQAVLLASCCLAATAAGPAAAGGIVLYEIGTADVGLASAGYTARAQDASTVFTNPAGMTRLDGNQLTFGAQLLHADLGFSIGPPTTPALGLESLLASRGLLDANLDLGITVPQGVNASFYRALDDRWALLGSVGWQQWSKFGKVDIGVDSNDPTALTTDADYKDTWHGALGAQYQTTGPWLVNFGVAYDSAFQRSTVSPALPANAAWRFGVGAQKTESRTFNWGLSAEYAYGGTLDVDQRGNAPIALGGRGDLVGSYKNTGILFLAANFNRKF